MGTKSFLLVRIASWEGEHPEIHHDGIPLEIGGFVRWSTTNSRDIVPKLWGCQNPYSEHVDCANVQKWNLYEWPVNQNTRKTLQFFPCLGEKIFTGRFSDVKKNGFRPSKWQCKQNGSQTAVFASVPSFGYLKALFMRLLAPRHAWCSSSNVLLLHGLFVGFLGFNPGRKHLSWMSVMMYKGGTAHPLERPKLQSYAVWPCPETSQVLRQITWQIKQVFEFWLVGRRNQLDSSYFDPQSFIDCDMQCYTTWWRLLRLCDQWSELGTRCIHATWWFGGGSAWFSFRSFRPAIKSQVWRESAAFRLAKREAITTCFDWPWKNQWFFQWIFG